MSRTRLAVLTALVMMVLSTAVFFTRRATGGADVGGPAGTSSWEVTITVRGTIDKSKHTYVVVSSPPEFRRQHVYDESWKCDELVRHDGRAAVRESNEREAVWKRRPMTDDKNRKPFTITHSFICTLGMHNPTLGMRERTSALDRAPQTDLVTRSAPRIESESHAIQVLARELAADSPGMLDQVRAFYAYVKDLPVRDTEGAGGALDCLQNTGSDAGGRSRLLVALCRNRGIPARVVTGIAFNANAPTAVHHWAEAYIRSPDGGRGYWLPTCPTYGHFGTHGWPTNYLVVRLDDEPIARGPGDLRVSVLARPHVDQPALDEPAIKTFWRIATFASLPPPEQHLVRFLLLLPLAALVVSLFRVLIGVRTYGVFSPALLGLIFRDLDGLPWGLGIFAGTVLVGWVFRKFLDRFNLLLIPRAAVMLTLIIGFLIVIVVLAARADVHVTGYIALFPLIILTHMVERFWTVEAEDGTRASFKTLLGTMIVAIAVALCLSPDAVSGWMFRYPETLGLVVAVLLLLGRYTGYRLTELYRFQDVIEFKEERDEVTIVEIPSKGKMAAMQSESKKILDAPLRGEPGQEEAQGAPLRGESGLWS
jgi:transglutaminase-like putative cysteine protease